MYPRTVRLLPFLVLALSISVRPQQMLRPSANPPTPDVQTDLHKQLQRPYDELFDTASSLNFTSGDLESMRRHLRQTQDRCSRNVRDQSRKFGREVDRINEEISKAGKNLEESRRHDLHCRIQELRSSKAQLDMLADHLVPVSFDNSRAKLELLEKWPAERRQIEHDFESEAYLNRRWGNITEIGYRKVQNDQKDDVKRGQDAIRELRQLGAMPPELENKAVQDYVNTIAQRIARNSDLQVPLNVMVLDSKEVNAFALPGGFLFVQRGLLEEVDDESELTGVLAHEMSHVAARHSWRLYKKAMVSSILFQAAQVAALIFTGGVGGIGTYYALQYGFYGLGMALDLNLLGVSREYELEADQLGIQYAWKSGYDPSGFIRFFDKLANKEGHAVGASWFRTHPAFYQRMVQSKREIMFLPLKPEMTVQTSDFEAMKQAVKEAARKSEDTFKGKRPTLLPAGAEEGCEKPKPLYKPGDSIDQICSEIGSRQSLALNRSR